LSGKGDVKLGKSPVVLNNPVNSGGSGLNLSESVSGIRLLRDDQGNLIGIVTVAVNPLQNPIVAGSIGNVGIVNGVNQVAVDAAGSAQVNLQETPSILSITASGAVVTGTPLQILAAGGAGKSYYIYAASLVCNLTGTAVQLLVGDGTIYVLASESTAASSGIATAQISNIFPIKTTANTAISVYNASATSANVSATLWYAGPK
jgi:hypothetical protein